MPYSFKATWLQNVPKEARDVIHSIIDDIEGFRPKPAHRPGSYYRWWVRLTPSTGIPRDVVLIAKSDFGAKDREWEIMKSGKLVESDVLDHRDS